MENGAADEAGWIRAAALSDLPVGKPVMVEVDETAVLLVRTEDQVFAAQNR